MRAVKKTWSFSYSRTQHHKVNIEVWAAGHQVTVQNKGVMSVGGGVWTVTSSLSAHFLCIIWDNVDKAPVYGTQSRAIISVHLHCWK